MSAGHILHIVWILLFLLSPGQIKAEDTPFRLSSKTSIQRKSVNKLFSHNDSIVWETPFPYITGFAISGEIIQNRQESFVRILLEDESGGNHVVLESSRLYNDVDTFSFLDYCEESQVLMNIKPRKLKIYVNNALVYLSEIQYIAGNKKGLNKSREKSLVQRSNSCRKKRIESRVELINEYNYKHNNIWRADTTVLASLPWEKRHIALGMSENDNTGGIEYYAEGIFEIKSPIRSDEQKDSIWASELSSNLCVEDFDWRNRHGRNWMTPVKNQWFTHACWAFSAIGVTEAMVNLYYNQKLDVNLSEQELISCSRNTINPLAGGSARNALQWIAANGVRNEEAFPFNNQNEWIPCSEKSDDYTEFVSFYQADRYRSQWSTHPDTIKRLLMKNGPTALSYHVTDTSTHSVVLTGFSRLRAGDGVVVSTRQGKVDITLSEEDDRIGKTYWICKNSYGTLGGGDGYIKLFLPGYDGGRGAYYIKTPMTTLTHTDNDIVCEDADGDGFYYWGIGSKPAHCPSWVPDTPDGDDSDYQKGPMDEYGHLANIADMQSDSTIYISQDTEWATRRYVYHPVYLCNGAELRITSDITFYKGVTLTIAAGSKLVIDHGNLKEVSIVYEGTAGTSIQIMNNGYIKCFNQQEFNVPLGVKLLMEHGTIN